jgi:hypothetical protein
LETGSAAGLIAWLQVMQMAGLVPDKLPVSGNGKILYFD